MKSRTGLLFTIAVSILFLLTGLVLYFLHEKKLLVFVVNLAYMLAIILLLYTGSFMSKRYFGVCLLFIPGMLFKILHLPGADEIIVVACGALIIFYTLHFFTKNQTMHWTF